MIPGPVSLVLLLSYSEKNKKVLEKFNKHGYMMMQVLIFTKIQIEQRSYSKKQKKRYNQFECTVYLDSQPAHYLRPDVFFSPSSYI